MKNVEQMSFLEVAVEVLADNNAAMSIKDIIAKVLEIKGVEDPEMEIGAKLYADMIASSKFVYMGEDKWNLKDAESLAEFEKDASEFNTADIKSKSKTSIEEMSGEKAQDVDSDDEDAADSDDEASDDDKVFDEEAYAENSEYDEESTGDYEDESEFDRETDDPNEDVDDFDEDKYNEYMDEYEDEYDK